MKSSTQRLLLRLALLLRRLLAHDVELPAGELAREPDVLAAAADRLRQLLLGDRDIHAVRLLVDDDRAHFGRRIALITNCAGLSSNGMMSTRSPAISFETACTREPRIPTQAPTGSMRGSLLRTAILARAPGVAGRAEDIDQALADFGHFELEELDQEFRAPCGVRNSCGPRGSARTSLRNALMRSCVRTGSRGIIWSRGMKPSALPPRSTKMPLRSTRLTMPDHERADAALVLVDDLRALGLAHLLHDHLLRGLRGDAAERHRLERTSTKPPGSA